MSPACVLRKQASVGAVQCSHPRGVSSSPDPNGSQPALWRPWLSSSRDGSERIPHSKLSCPYSRSTCPCCLVAAGKPQSFQHPVRLFWPKSKSFDYLYSDGVALLRNFPIQATISFYEESDCEDDDEYEEDWEEDGNSEVCLKQLSHSTHYN
ncbi:putative protein ripply1-like [Scophthalmus maximus]|uniref:Ripply transcriptional repressor 1 n=1 Tax=Scophthalmus maximus TaxID=52904 RepID=A0A2U9B9K1_SCOMX|nr:protein ripply3 [Scophthalmus maximus]AWP00544.1 putative protein ripply1-like [Scophthalmus maximus]